MKAWAANVAGRGRESFCEQCGVTGTVRAERRVADRPRGRDLLACRSCSLVTCPACWPGPFLTCRACSVRQDPALVTLVGEARPRGDVTVAAVARARRPRERPRRAGVLAAMAVVVTLVAGAVAIARPGTNAGGVAGLAARSTPSARAAASADVPRATPSAEPAGTSSPGVEPSPSLDATARPGTPADLRVTSSAVRPWVDALGELRAQVLVGVTNEGGTSGYLPSGATPWEVVSPDGFAVAQGRFAHVFPRLVAPGGTAWLVDAVSAAFTEPGELAAVRVTLEERAATVADLGEQGSLTVRNVQWRLDRSGGVLVSGVVENRGSRPIGRWSAAVVLLGAEGDPLAAAYEIGDVDGLAPGATVWFSTAYPGSPPVEGHAVASVEAVAVPLD